MLTSAHRFVLAMPLSLLMALSFPLMGCGDEGECGPGTSEEGGFCRPIQSSDDDEAGTIVRCGDGTVLEDGQCVPEQPVLTCGEGTMESDGRCVAVDNEPDEEAPDADAQTSQFRGDSYVDAQEEVAVADAMIPGDLGPTDEDGSDALVLQETEDVATDADAASVPLADVSGDGGEGQLSAELEDVAVEDDVPSVVLSDVSEQVDDGGVNTELDATTDAPSLEDSDS
jgi:hypothetical protein